MPVSSGTFAICNAKCKAGRGRAVIALQQTRREMAACLFSDFVKHFFSVFVFSVFAAAACLYLCSSAEIISSCRCSQLESLLPANNTGHVGRVGLEELVSFMAAACVLESSSRTITT